MLHIIHKLAGPHRSVFYLFIFLTKHCLGVEASLQPWFPCAAVAVKYDCSCKLRFSVSASQPGHGVAQSTVKDRKENNSTKKAMINDSTSERFLQNKSVVTSRLQRTRTQSRASSI